MSELSLDLKPIAITTTTTSSTSTSTTTTTYVPQSINVFLGEVSLISNVSEKFSKVDGFVQRLKEEMNKIDAFKRELPLCMLLLNDAIGVLRRETMQWNTSGSSSAAAAAAAVIMEKCVPLKTNSSEIDLRDKKNWMSSAQLWTSNGYSSNTDDEKPKPVVNEVIAKKDDGSAATTIETILPRNGGGAFVPFKGFTGFLTSTRREEKEKEIQLEAGLSLVTPGVKKPRTEPTTSCLMNSKTYGGTGSRGLPASSSEINQQTNLQMPLQSQPPRKQRRCWSADLHRRFLHALQQLGGSQAATPKQIRELMKVDGLTNDEVKSHLQKYRLHTRRYPANANSPAPENQKLALFGGLWAPENQCGASKASTSQSESPQGPLHLMTSGGSTTGDDSMEDDEEDGKSESYTWKGHFYKPGDDEA